MRCGLFLHAVVMCDTPSPCLECRQRMEKVLERRPRCSTVRCVCTAQQYPTVRSQPREEEVVAGMRLVVVQGGDRVGAKLGVM